MPQNSLDDKVDEHTGKSSKKQDQSFDFHALALKAEAQGDWKASYNFV